jgi:O-succinylbenzoate synthase
MPHARADYLQLDYRAYRRKFVRPLATGGGVWAAREGVIVRLMDSHGRMGFGEAAPIPTFTGETAARDLAWLRRAPDEVTRAELRRVPVRLACLRWALFCAQAMLAGKLQPPAKIKKLPVAALLPAGRTAVAMLDLRAGEGYRVFKWKIGVAPPPEEFSLLEQLLAALPAHGRLRLDANGSLSRLEWAAWCDGLNSLGPAARALEFFEQPLPPATGRQGWREQVRLAAIVPVPVALDEGVAGWPALRRASAAKWPGPLVVKPSMLGHADDFLRWRAQSRPDLVYSSSFETSVGVQAALCVAAGDPHAGQRALGFGTLDAFADDGLQLPDHAPGPNLALKKLSSADFVGIWNRLAP